MGSPNTNEGAQP